MTAFAVNRKAYLALLIVYIVWGTTLAGMHYGIQTIPTALLPCARFLFAGVLLVGWCLLRGEKLPGRKDLQTNFIIGALLFFGGNSLVVYSIRHITTGLSGLLVATSPFFMVWLSATLPPREKVSLPALVGIVIGFIGMGVLLSPQLTHMQNTTWIFWASVILMLVNVFSWSLGSIYARKHQTRQVSLLMSVGLQNFFAGLLLIPLVLYTVKDWSAIHPSLVSMSALAYLVLFGTILATPCYMYVLHTLPVSVSSTFAYVTPIVTVIFGWMFLGEPMSATTALGAVIILAGVIVVQWVNQQQSKAAAHKAALVAEEARRLQTEEVITCT